jgi:hypothetical protein
MNPELFFRKLVPEEWNRRLEQELASGPSGAERAAKLQSADFSLEVRVSGDTGGRYYLMVERGRMRASPGPEGGPLVTLALTLADWRRLADEIGPSPMALLGGVAGQQDFAVTGARVARLRELRATLRLQVTGEGAWGVSLHFGPEPMPPEPATAISIGADEYRRMRSGELDLQGAFMSGKLSITGDVDPALRLAMALMTPE